MSLPGLEKNQDQEQESNPALDLAKKKVKNSLANQAKRLGRKVAKKALALAAKLLVKLLAATIKLIVAFFATIGLPVTAGIVIVLALIIVVSLAFTFFFSDGQDLTGKEKEIHEYIVEQSDKTVDMSKPEQIPYKVPVGLIAAFIQLDVMKGEDTKAVIKEMAEKLRPTFEYGKNNEYLETQVTKCREDKCTTGKVNRKNNWVSVLNSVEYWSGSKTITYKPYVTDWRKETKVTYVNEKYTETERYTESEKYNETKTEAIKKTRKVPYQVVEYVTATINGITVLKPKTVTKYRTETYFENVTTVTPKTREVEKVRDVEKTKQVKITTVTKTRQQKFQKNENVTEDYSMLESIFNSYGLSLNDKKLLEANYLFVGGQINYTEWLAGNYGGAFDSWGTGTDGGFIGNVMPGSGVPPQFMQYYLGAESKYGVPWYYLAAIHFVETRFSQEKIMVSSVGAIGHMQFMPATWVGWKYNIGGGLVSVDYTNLSLIKKGGGYGVDADGDGKADPYSLADAIHSAANYLSANNFKKDPYKAIFTYNNADWYVKKVMTAANKYHTEATYTPGDGTVPVSSDTTFTLPTRGRVTSGFGGRWGTQHYGLDIADTGTVPIVAAADGIVSRSYRSSSYGNVVFIKHNIKGQSYETVYAHMNSRAVKEGQPVKRGQFLGNMGSTGQSTGQHLHFEVHTGSGWNISKSNAKNPALYLPLNKLN